MGSRRKSECSLITDDEIARIKAIWADDAVEEARRHLKQREQLREKGTGMNGLPLFEQGDAREALKKRCREAKIPIKMLEDLVEAEIGSRSGSDGSVGFAGTV